MTDRRVGGTPTGGIVAIVALVGALALAGCISPPGATPAAAEETDWRFEEVTEEAGFEEPLGSKVNIVGNYMKSLIGGLSVGDADGDGWPDLYVATVGHNRLYLNQGNGTFENVAAEAGVAGGDLEASMQGLFLDYDNDGDQDLFVANYGQPSRVYENQGGATFEDVTEDVGGGMETWAYGATARDVDGDGYLDITVLNYKGPRGSVSSYTNATNGPRDLVWMNRQGWGFTERGGTLGVDAHRFTFSHAWADYDEDGDEDLYMNVDFGHDVLYQNIGQGRFRDATGETGAVTDENGMGAVWTDVDNDLELDLFATNIHMPRAETVDHWTGNDLFIQENDTFHDEARQRGVHAGGWGWDSAWADLDHDGDVDGYQANGMWTRDGRDLYYDSEIRIVDEELSHAHNIYPLGRWNETHWGYLAFPDGGTLKPDRYAVAGDQVDPFFRNRGNGTFEDAADEVGFGQATDSRALALLDYDRDGDLDMVRTTFEDPPRLFENQAADVADEEDPRHWLQVELQGTMSNRDAVGARVVVEAGNQTMLRQTTAGQGFMSQDQSALHFGLGNRSTVDEVRVTWPSGATASFTDLPADQAIRVTEPDTLETGIWS